MHICLLSKMFPPGGGGSEMYAYEIANALGARGHNVDVITQSNPGEKKKANTHDNVSVIRICKARKYLVTFETLYYSLRSRFSIDFDDYDVIHGTLMPASTIGLIGKSDADTPVVLTSHSFALREIFAHDAEKLPDYLLKFAFHPMNAVMDNIAARSANHIVAISQEMAGQLSNTYGLPSEKITHITHGVDSDKFRPDVEPYTAINQDKLTLLFVGRLITRKKAGFAIETLANIGHPDVELVIAGKGRRRPELEQRARELGVDDQTKFLGYVPEEELPSLYATADLCLFTSNYEGFGLVILEAMASGTPIVGRHVGGVPDVVRDGNNGIICSGGSEKMANRISPLASNPDELEQMSRAARERAEELSWDRVASELERIYQTL